MHSVWRTADLWVSPRQSGPSEEAWRAALPVESRSLSTHLHLCGAARDSKRSGSVSGPGGSGGGTCADVAASSLDDGGGSGMADSVCAVVGGRAKDSKPDA